MNQELRRHHYAVIGLAAVLGVVLAAVVGFSVAYAGKIYPGVTVNGVDLSGLDQAQAASRLSQQLSTYNAEQIPVQYGQTTLQIPVSSLQLKYPDTASENAYKHGRTGNVSEQFNARVRALLARQTRLTGYSYDDSGLKPFLDQISDDVSAPVTNASISFDGGKVVLNESSPGKRTDPGLLVQRIEERLAVGSVQTVRAPVYEIKPSVTSETLDQVKDKASAYANAQLNLTAGSVTQSVNPNQIAKWIDVNAEAGRTDLTNDSLTGFYNYAYVPKIDLSPDRKQIAAYISDLAAKVDVDPQNAALAMQNGQLTVTQASHKGASLDQDAATLQIVTALKQTGSHDLTLAVKTTDPEVNENNLDQLGIKDQLSEGETFFPGSPATRMTNIRVGAAKYNGVLLKPGEMFSFGKILGDVGPAQGYVPELVILENHEEKQYGGGLCQVASTAFRAALLAGLPITERHNHSFAVSYYTAPYDAPGVDATIYYPQVDFKFQNDTGHYMLIQTVMEGTTLKFDFFGTKTKYGEIRPPQFVSGTNDATQPSHTVFWRDIKDLNGNIIKTNQFDTYYKSSKDFPVQKQFN
jgi:vancomycin resistance protein YoaR